DVETGEAEETEPLKHSGIHSLLGIRLPVYHTLMGVLYIGVAAKRAFTASELRRIASLGDQLTVHLDNAQLVAGLREKIDAIGGFVDVLAHDLRRPLTDATVSAQRLAEDPDSLSERLPRLQYCLRRAQQMVTDLLDAHRIQAGQPLPLNRVEFDLS